MTLRLTPDTLAAAYDFLRTTDPFKAWKLPHSDEVAFHVTRNPKVFADFSTDEDGGPLIRVSSAKNGHTATALMSMGHEMLHLHQYLSGLDKGSEHNPDFKRKAKRICQIHGWDEHLF
jgi:hypothetical protein